MDIAVFEELYDVYRKHLGSIFPGAEPARILSVLRVLREASCAQERLIEIFKIKQPAVAKLVGKLTAAGFVEHDVRNRNGVRKIKLSSGGYAAITGFEAELSRVLATSETVQADVPSAAPRKQSASRPKSTAWKRALARRRRSLDQPDQKPLVFPGSNR